MTHRWSAAAVSSAWDGDDEGSFVSHLWLGPAPQVPCRPNLLPGIWRWWYEFGCADCGNDGIHDLDFACWGLGATTHPSRVVCFGVV